MSFYHISEISLNGERYPGLLVKFLRPIPGKEGKKITIKILSSGKINLDGCTSEIEVVEIYHWVQYIFIKYWSEVVYDSSVVIKEVVSSDSESGYESIYDQ
jgi:TATA-box binding protein (TBP) (component of TFIID and TFIIIB)